MKSNRRDRRQMRRRSRRRPYILNLVSLMDIFTILVFFLLVNSIAPSELPSNSNLVLPSSLAEQTPRDTLHIMITQTNILVNGKHLIYLNELDEKHTTLPSLGTALDKYAARYSETQRQEGLPVTLFSHKEIPYSTVKKVLNTVNQHHHTKLSLAVIRRAGDSTT